MRVLENANISLALYAAIIMWCFLAIETEVFMVRANEKEANTGHDRSHMADTITANFEAPATSGETKPRPADGETVKITTWFKCVAWDKKAELINKHFHSGDPIMIEGKLKPGPNGSPEIWSRQDGSPAADYEVTVLEFYFLPKGDRNQPA